MKLIYGLVAFLLAFSGPAYALDKKILMLISSYGTEETPGLSYDLEELAQAYLVMHDNGVELAIASPRGGAVLIKQQKDHLSYIKRFKALAQDKLESTLATASLDASDFDAVFIVGGGGAMMDLPVHGPTQTLLGQFVHQDKLISAVCHGPAAIAQLKLDNGSYFVANKKVNGFTNVEENAFSEQHLADFGFLLEDRLVESGARFVSNQPMLPYVVADGQLITAQNPASVATAAELTLVKLGVEPKPREAFTDEATMMLISTARTSGAALLEVALAASPQKYDMDLLALYGYYAYLLAPEKSRELELELMAVIGRYFQHEKYDRLLIERLVEQQLPDLAQRQFAQFAERYPQHPDIQSLKALLTSVSG